LPPLPSPTSHLNPSHLLLQKDPVVHEEQEVPLEEVGRGHAQVHPLLSGAHEVKGPRTPYIRDALDVHHSAEYETSKGTHYHLDVRVPDSPLKEGGAEGLGYQGSEVDRDDEPHKASVLALLDLGASRKMVRHVPGKAGEAQGDDEDEQGQPKRKDEVGEGVGEAGGRGEDEDDVQGTPVTEVEVGDAKKLVVADGKGKVNGRTEP